MPVQDGRPRPRIVRAPISKVAFLVCSRSRIAPLSECIAGIAAQTPVTGLAVDIVVADNAETSRAEFIRSLHPGLHYVHEPARGYSNVRNAALRCALAATDADVLIFIDDLHFEPELSPHVRRAASDQRGTKPA